MAGFKPTATSADPTPPSSASVIALFKSKSYTVLQLHHFSQPLLPRLIPVYTRDPYAPCPILSLMTSATQVGCRAKLEGQIIGCNTLFFRHTTTRFTQSVGFNSESIRHLILLLLMQLLARRIHKNVVCAPDLVSTLRVSVKDGATVAER
jgi:hypothetical protein